MKKLIWRIKFAYYTRKIFSKPKGAFKGNHLLLGWRTSGRIYSKYKDNDPWQAALSEISDWYNL